MPLHVSRIRAICFDVDGTLNDTDNLAQETFARLLKLVWFLFPKQDIHHLARRIVMAGEAPANLLIGIPDLLGIDDEIYTLAGWLARRGSRRSKKFMLIPGVKEMLAPVG